MIEVENRGVVSVLRMARGKGNALNLGFARRAGRSVERAGAGTGSRGRSSPARGAYSAPASTCRNCWPAARVISGVFCR